MPSAIWSQFSVPYSFVAPSAVTDKLTDKAIIGIIEIEAEALEGFEIRLRESGENVTSVKLVDGFWVFDRSKSGEPIVGAEKDEYSLSGIRRMPYTPRGKTTVSIVLDKYSVEFFENGRVMSSTVYPPDGADKIELSVKAGKCVYTRYEIAD